MSGESSQDQSYTFIHVAHNRRLSMSDVSSFGRKSPFGFMKETSMAPESTFPILYGLVLCRLTERDFPSSQNSSSRHIKLFRGD